MDDHERMTRIEERVERFSEQTRAEMQSVDVRLTRIESRLDQMATRTDLEQAINSVVKWVVGTVFGAAVVAVTVMTFALNNAVPKPAAALAAPVVIQLPPLQQVPAKP
jgi:transketolase